MSRNDHFKGIFGEGERRVPRAPTNEAESAKDVRQWHVSQGGHCGRLAGHALKLLEEAVELAVVAGAGRREIEDVVAFEIDKARSRAEFVAPGVPVPKGKVLDELADVALLVDLLEMHLGGWLEDAKRRKVVVLGQREWLVDPDGVLYRPGRRRKRRSWWRRLFNVGVL